MRRSGHPRVTFVLAKVTKTVLPRKARRLRRCLASSLASGGAHTACPYAGCARTESLRCPVGLDFGLFSTLARLRGGSVKLPWFSVGPRMTRVDCQHRDVLSGHLRDKGAYARGMSRHSGACFLWFLSLHEQRKEPAHICRRGLMHQILRWPLGRPQELAQRRVFLRRQPQIISSVDIAQPRQPFEFDA